MENNMMKIAERVYKLVKQQELITEDTEFNILYQIADELLSEMGEIENLRIKNFKGLSLYKDVRFKGGFFTYDNIPPKYIELI